MRGLRHGADGPRDRVLAQMSNVQGADAAGGRGRGRLAALDAGPAGRGLGWHAHEPSRLPGPLHQPAHGAHRGPHLVRRRDVRDGVLGRGRRDEAVPGGAPAAAAAVRVPAGPAGPWGERLGVYRRRFIRRRRLRPDGLGRPARGVREQRCGARQAGHQCSGERREALRRRLSSCGGGHRARGSRSRGHSQGSHGRGDGGAAGALECDGRGCAQAVRRPAVPH